MKILIISLFIFTGCSHVSYLTTQLAGQLRLVNTSRSNDEVLDNIKIRPRDKKKILDIQKYKNFFYEFWQIRQVDIYNRTTILKNKAVTYLVVASKPNIISAKDFCFPFAGCFPYLGFFDIKDAEVKRLELEKDGLVTDIRSVYAYSTLGYMSDPIISSLFLFDEMELAEVIFHELFHTLFFVKNDVAFNEALADFMALHLLDKYFDKNSATPRLIQRRKQKILNKQMVQLTAELNNEYKKATGGHDKILESFLQNRLKPSISAICSQEGILPKECYPLDKSWNNATLSGFLTYASDGDWIEKLYTTKANADLSSFYNFLRSEYNRFESSNSSSFSEFLRSQL
jgi:predicted aminopeptidase